MKLLVCPFCEVEDSIEHEPYVSKNEDGDSEIRCGHCDWSPTSSLSKDDSYKRGFLDAIQKMAHAVELISSEKDDRK